MRPSAITKWLSESTERAEYNRLNIPNSMARVIGAQGAAWSDLLIKAGINILFGTAAASQGDADDGALPPAPCSLLTPLPTLCDRSPGGIIKTNCNIVADAEDGRAELKCNFSVDRIRNGEERFWFLELTWGSSPEMVHRTVITFAGTRD